MAFYKIRGIDFGNTNDTFNTNQTDAEANDRTSAQLEQSAKELYESGKMSKEEYKELMKQAKDGGGASFRLGDFV